MTWKCYSCALSLDQGRLIQTLVSQEWVTVGDMQVAIGCQCAVCRSPRSNRFKPDPLPVLRAAIHRLKDIAPVCITSKWKDGERLYGLGYGY